MHKDQLNLSKEQYKQELELSKEQHKEHLETQATHNNQLEMQAIKSAQMAQVYAFMYSRVMDSDATFIRERLKLHCQGVSPGSRVWNPIPLLGVKSYRWVPKKDEYGQREDYHKHMKPFLDDSFSWRLEVVGVEHDNHALSVSFFRHGIQLNGIGDMLITPRGEVGTRTKLARAIIEVKKDKNDVWTPSQVHHQAMPELLALDQLASGIVFSVLTDLREAWFFYWLGSNRQLQSLQLGNLHVGVMALREFLKANCSWNGLPQRIHLTCAAGQHIYATKCTSELMLDQAPQPAPASGRPSFKLQR